MATIAGPSAAISLVERTDEEPAAAGIPEGLVRYVVGIEDVRDLKADLEQALSGLCGVAYRRQQRMRVEDHPILGTAATHKTVTIYVDGEPMPAYEGEPIAAALMAAGKWVFRYSKKRSEPRGYFCGLGRCTDCIMTVDGIPQVRTCITPVAEGMHIETQKGHGEWGENTC